jgi:DNA polymerase-3 subunit chi
MTRIDFYILEAQQETVRELFCCRLVEKAYNQGHKIFINTRDQEQLQRLNQLLWTFRDGSFIPHDIYSDEQSEAAVQLGHQQQPQYHHDVLVNLADETPLYFSQFSRLAEVTSQQLEIREQARKRFKFYRDRGYPLNHHKIDG